MKKDIKHSRLQLIAESVRRLGTATLTPDVAITTGKTGSVIVICQPCADPASPR